MTKKQDHKRRLIIEKALDCLIENGIENTTIAMIAQRSEVPERSIYRYFQTKERIVYYAEKLFWDYIYIGIELSANRIPPLERTGINRIKAAMNHYMVMLTLSPEIFILLQEIDIYLHNHHFEAEEKRDMMIENSEEPIAAGFSCAAEDGTIRSDIDLHIAYETVHDAFFGLMKTLAFRLYIQSPTERKTPPQLIFFSEMVIDYLKRA